MRLTRSRRPAWSTASAVALVTLGLVLVATAVTVAVVVFAFKPDLTLDDGFDLNKVVIVISSGGSGSRSIALLLDKMGVFMATGRSDCVKRSASACERASDNVDTACSDSHLDMHFEKPLLFLTEPLNLRGLKREWSDEDVDTSAYAERCLAPDPLAISDGSRHIDHIQQAISGTIQRAAACANYGSWDGYTPPLVGFKAPSLLSGVPAIAGLMQQRPPANATAMPSPSSTGSIANNGSAIAAEDPDAPKGPFVVLVTRDGRDIAVRNWKHLQVYAEAMRVPLGTSPAVEKAEVWSRLNLQALLCGQQLVPPSQWIHLKTEDFVLGDAAHRRAHILQLQQRLGIPELRRPMEELLAVFDQPIDAAQSGGANFSAHYGKWRAALDEDTVAKIENITSGALRSFGYQGGGGEIGVDGWMQSG